jgi:hypothetical protein
VAHANQQGLVTFADHRTTKCFACHGGKGAVEEAKNPFCDGKGAFDERAGCHRNAGGSECRGNEVSDPGGVKTGPHVTAQFVPYGGRSAARGPNLLWFRLPDCERSQEAKSEKPRAIARE